MATKINTIFRSIPLLLLASCSGQNPPQRLGTEAPVNVLPNVVPAVSTTVPVANADSPRPPVAKKEPRVTELFGRKLVDDYAWMRKKDSPEVLAHLRAEKAYTDAMTEHLAPLRDRVYGEILGRLRETDDTVPAKDGNWLYYSRTEKGKQYKIHARKPVAGGANAREEILLDLNEIGKTEAYVGLGPYVVSDDGKWLAYGLDTTGFRQFVLHVKDLTTGKELPARFERVTSVVFAKDNKTVLYTVEDPVAKRSYQLHRYEIGTDPAKDVLVHEEKDERFELHVSRSSSEELIFLNAESHTTTEVQFIRSDKPKEKFQLVAPREQDHEYQVDHHHDELVIRTNAPTTSGAAKSTNFRLVTTKLASPGRASWKEVIAHRPEVMLEYVRLFKDFGVVMEREGGLRHLRILDAKKLSLEGSHRIALPEALGALEWGKNSEFDQAHVRFVFESPTTPSSAYDYFPQKRALELKKRLDVPNYDATRYEAKRVHAVASDGTKVPITLLYKKGTTPDGKNPAYIYGYGSYGAPWFPEFDAAIFSLVDRGIVTAVAHIRGGGEMGEAWHDAGRMKQKMNTFTDFIAVTETLVRDGWAAKDRIAIEGISAGGLLMGAVTNMRPDLYRAVVAEVPFVDVINTMLDEDLPLTVGEFEEWGNPKKEEEFGWMIQYSPYDNVKRQAYPRMLVKTSYNDSQVMYWEPAKWVAKLREYKTNDAPVLLNINLEPAGHGGKSGRYEQMKETAFKYAWVMEQLEAVGVALLTPPAPLSNFASLRGEGGAGK
jgi:oligopeptidase B